MDAPPDSAAVKDDDPAPCQQMEKALSIYLITRGISSFLSLNDMKMARASNSIWTDAVHPHFLLERSPEVTLKIFDDLVLYPRLITPDFAHTDFNLPANTTFSPSMLKPLCKKFGKGIESLRMRLDSALKLTFADDYIGLCGILNLLPCLKHLQITIQPLAIFPNSSLPELTLPNLQKLSINFQKFTYDNHQGLAEASYEMQNRTNISLLLLRSTPKLQFLEINTEYRPVDTRHLENDIKNYFSQVVQTVNDSCPSMTELGLTGTDIKIGEGMELNVSLKRLEIKDFDWDSEDCIVQLRRMLQKNRCTLEHLKISGLTFELQSLMISMPKLKEMEFVIRQPGERIAAERQKVEIKFEDSADLFPHGWNANFPLLNGILVNSPK